MRLIFYIFLLLSTSSLAQNNYPQNYFRSPLDITLVLSGTFAELRSNHFHSGLDIKTQQRTGLNVYTSAGGFVSRIKVSHFGYGKALYITHPNGYTTVYAHLLKFSPKIEAYVKNHQYKKESFQIELFPNAEDLKIEKDEIVALSGNTGGSGGPHLHFEIRDKQERPINPMLFGIDIKDSVNPIISSIYAYPLDENSFINTSNTKKKLRIIPLKNGDYTVENIEAYGKIGFGIETIDRQNLAANKNGVYNIQTFVNGNKNFELDFKRFSFSETKNINKLIDYAHYKTKKKRIQKLFNQNNTLSIYKEVLNNGILNIKDSTYSVYKIKVGDYKKNNTWATVTIKGSKSDTNNISTKKTTPYFINKEETTNLKKGKVSVDFYKDTFYDNFYLDFDVSNDTLSLHEDIIPTKKSFKISYDVSAYSDKDKSKLYIAKLLGYKKFPSYSSTKRKDNILTTYSKTLGEFVLATDTIKPKITPINFKKGQWLSNFRYLKIKIDDELSGISNYRATVNGTWILMEYDYKTKTLTHDFNDGIITETKNNLKVIVTDNVGNNSTFETVFYRK
ncbi:M23 family metallopeptidase [Sabulilitoribacter arenilitoris]|uniref:M23 family metallopeptidase n=1 Tax=Wocania arenilitoris TaxID=2044858 RepID=A0AAE3ERZ7_9FLAO|nr:M23 family metallopeptidase [Wocania arenilitoris]MCF7569344.1 M23 family metallopeptidase [Wocania arenilitoris]